MSNEYNGAGKTLVVDDVVVVKSQPSQSSSEMRQIIDAVLLKRNTVAVRALIESMGADDNLSPLEKQTLAREYRTITASHSVLVSKAESYGIDGQSVYTGYLASYQELVANLDDLLAVMSVDTPITSHSYLLALFDTYYLKVSLLEEEVFMYTTGLLDGLDDRTKLELNINSALGLTVPLDNTPTELSAMLLRDGEDVTSQYDQTCFFWERFTADRVGDATWGASRNLTGKSLSVSLSDFGGDSASFICRFHLDYGVGMHLAQTGFITLNKEIPGVQGEPGAEGRSYRVEISSSNGNIFRPGESFLTVFTARVYLNAEEITGSLPDTAFRWIRASVYVREPPDDDASWNLSHATGYRQVSVLADSPLARATYGVEVSI